MLDGSLSDFLPILTKNFEPVIICALIIEFYQRYENKMKEFISHKAKNIFGEEYDLVSLQRLFGGAQKYTYLARCSNGFSFVIYKWDKSTTYFDSINELEIFCSNSAVLFERNNALMRKYGIMTPKLFYIDKSRKEQNYEYAFVEYIDGVDMDFIIANEPERLPYIVDSLINNINRLHNIKSSAVGQLNRMQDNQFNVIDYELENMHRNCLYLQENDSEYATLYIGAENKAIMIAERIEKRKEYSFIHSELGPNHVMVDKKNNAYLIDIEGAGFYDVEKENSFIKFRFGDCIIGFKDDLNEDRMQFYHIQHCFGNLRGAIELKQKGYYDMDDVNGMIDFFHGQFKNL